MGITGLIPFMEKASRQVNISQYKGSCVAIDAYCWLHKGAYTCAEKLARGEDCDAYVHYCMKYVNMLLSHNIKPILVFDGRHLPAKAGTEKKRRESREISRKRAAELLRAGRSAEATSFLRRCVDVTHEMALNLMKECRRRNVDCIVAPYEADSQLAYLNIKNIAQIVITEDSDLVLFGCTRILFKMDLVGNGVMVESDRLHLAMGVRPENFSFDKFRYMCILSGCDYLPSLPGIGLSKACKFITRTSDPDIHKSLSRLPMFLNMRQLVVTPEYRDEFLRADATFRYQLVFDPVLRKQLTLTPPPANYKPADYTGRPLPSDTAYQLALGNLDPFTLNPMDSFDPDNPQPVKGGKTTSWEQSLQSLHPTMWSRDFKTRPVAPKINPLHVDRPNTKGKEVNKGELNLTQTSKRTVAPDTSLTSGDLTSLYSKSPPAKKPRMDVLDDDEILSAVLESTPVKERQDVEEAPVASPVLGRVRRNPFAKKSHSPKKAAVVVQKAMPENKFSALAKFERLRRASDGNVVESRYFKKDEAQSATETKDVETSSEKLHDISNAITTPVKCELATSPVSRKSRTPLKGRVYISKDGLTVISPIKKSVFSEMDNNEEIELISPIKATEPDVRTFSGEKTNLSINENGKINSCQKNLLNAFKWGSLSDRFGYQKLDKSSVKSTLASTKDFKSPFVKTGTPDRVFDTQLQVDEEDVDDPCSFEDSQLVDSSYESASSQNAQVECSLPTPLDEDCSIVDEGFFSQTPLVPSVPEKKPCRQPGLGKNKLTNMKRSKSPKQQNLLKMFGFQPRVNKLQHRPK